MSAEDFLQRVEQTGMVSEPLLIELRKRVGETHRQMRPEMLAKLLVDRGELTPAQARKLVADTKEGGGPPPLPTDDDAPAPQVPIPPAAYIEDEPEEELRLVTDDDGADEPEAEVDLSGGMGVDLGDDLLADVPPPPTSASAGDDELTLAPNMDDDELGLAPEEEVAEGILLDEEDNDLEIVPVAEPATEPETGIEPVANEASHSGPILDDILADPLATQDKVVIRRRRSMFRTITDLFPGGGNRNRKKRWDSPLILLGGAALVLLIAAGFALVGLFYGESADEVFTAGMDAYESQSYSAAIKTFNKFERQFSTHDKASLARVRVQLANLRMLTDKPTPDWEAALSQADISLNAAKVEEAFPEVRSELAKLLPDISAGLVGVAKGAETTDQKQAAIDLAVNSLTLVDNPEYLPTSVRKPQEIRIEEIQSEIAVVRRDIERERALSKTIGEIATATESGKIADAYRLRDKLVTTYPLLLDDVSLGDAIGAVTEKEKEAVKVGVSELKPTTQDHPPVSRVSVVLSDQRGSALDGLGNRVVGVLVRGAVYGLKASNGQTLWRRHVGWECSVFPQEIRGDGSGDLLLVDAAHGELQRVHADNGKLVWRLPCPKPLSTPRIEGGKAYVCCGSGPESRLLSVDLKGGSVSAEARFPVGCSTPPTIISERGEVIQPGTHSSVYVLEAGSLKCKRVFASRHARDSIVAPATWIGSSLLLAENNGTSAATLHTFTPVGEDDAWRRDAAPLKTAGQVVAWPAVNDRRVVIVTDLGEIRVLEAPLEGNGLREIASIGDSGKSVGASWPLLDRARLWLANDTFTQYELQSTRGQLVTRWSRDRSDRFLNPIQRVGDYLVHVRRRRGMSGATVAAAPVNSPDGAPVWETDIGVPGSVVIGSGGKVHAVHKERRHVPRRRSRGEQRSHVGTQFPCRSASYPVRVLTANQSRWQPADLRQSSAHQACCASGSRCWTSRTHPASTQWRHRDFAAGELRRFAARCEFRRPHLSTRPD